MNQHKTIVEISPKSVFLVILSVLLLVALWQVISVVFMFFIAFILSVAFKPIVNLLERYKIPRPFSALTIIIFIFVFGAFGSIAVVNELVNQFVLLVENSPAIAYGLVSEFQKYFPFLDKYIDAELVRNNLNNIVESLMNMGPGIISTGAIGVFDVVKNTFSLAFSAIMVLVMTAIMIIRKDNVYDGILGLINRKNRTKYNNLIKIIENKLSEWMRTQMTVMMIIGFITWTGIILPSIFMANNYTAQFAFPIAFIAMILEILPGTGVGFAGILSALIALSTGQIPLAIYYMVFFFGFQQIETLYLIPTVMKKVVGIDPILTITGLFAFFTLFGLIGAILVVPILIVTQYVIDFGIDGEVNSV